MPRCQTRLDWRYLTRKRVHRLMFRLQRTSKVGDREHCFFSEFDFSLFRVVPWSFVYQNSASDAGILHDLVLPVCSFTTYPAASACEAQEIMYGDLVQPCASSSPKNSSRIIRTANLSCSYSKLRTSGIRTCFTTNHGLFARRSFMSHASNIIQSTGQSPDPKLVLCKEFAS